MLQCLTFPIDWGKAKKNWEIKTPDLKKKHL